MVRVIRFPLVASLICGLPVTQQTALVHQCWQHSRVSGVTKINHFGTCKAQGFLWFLICCHALHISSQYIFLWLLQVKSLSLLFFGGELEVGKIHLRVGWAMLQLKGKTNRFRNTRLGSEKGFRARLSLSPSRLHGW